MPTFTCELCQEVVKGSAIDRHCVGSCANAWYFTCIDCHKRFEGYDYKNHTSCITEAEKYHRVVRDPAKLKKPEWRSLIVAELKKRKSKSMPWKALAMKIVEEAFPNFKDKWLAEQLCIANIPNEFIQGNSHLVTLPP